MKNTESTREFGKKGERAASRYLARKGFRTVAKNVYVGKKEIDFIAKGGGYLLFVEVKTRRQEPDSDSPWGRPGSAVDARKREYLLYAARKYIFDNPEKCKGLQPRIDLVEVYADPEKKRFRVLEIRHFPNAVRP